MIRLHCTSLTKNRKFACWKGWASALLALSLLAPLVLLGGCTAAPVTPTPTPAASPLPGSQGLTEDEIATLSSLEKLDEAPLYSMRYYGAYAAQAAAPAEAGALATTAERPAEACPLLWGCSLFAALGGHDGGSGHSDGTAVPLLYGRNFDWNASPALLLYTDPPDGYASLAMVDIEYLGFSGSQADNLLGLPLNLRRALLNAPALPFDGMNEKGVAVGMAAVSAGNMRADPEKSTIGELAVIREILDHAGTVDEAVAILGSYNIDMSEVPIHYLIASAAGDAALVEFYQGKMHVLRSGADWQAATNFLVTATNGQPQGQCPRYDRLSQRLQETGGKLTIQQALDLLAEVAQGNTQWSVVYDMTSGSASIVMGRKYAGGVHTVQLSQPGR